MSARWTATAAAAIVLLASAVAIAHQVGLSRGEYKLSGSTLYGALAFSQGEMIALFDGADTDRDSHLSAAELERVRPAIEKAIVDKIKVTSSGAACAPALAYVGLDEEDGVEIRATFACASAPRKLHVEIGFLDDLSHGHRHIAKASGGATPVDIVLYSKSPGFDLDVGGRPTSAPTPSVAVREPSYLSMGLLHTLTGVDDLLFLVALVLVGGTLRQLGATLGAFTAAQSSALALAVLGGWGPGRGVVAPAIALSIAYVGVDNFVEPDARKRWRIAVPFGLILGFGIARPLLDAALSRGNAPAKVALFDAGVIAGQLGALVIIVPLVLLARKKEAFKGVGVKLLSASIAVAGLVWFVLRALGSSA